MPRIENQTIEFHDMQSVLGQKFGGNCQIITANSFEQMPNNPFRDYISSGGY
jgi:hypothetical protein